MRAPRKRRSTAGPPVSAVCLCVKDNHLKLVSHKDDCHINTVQTSACFACRQLWLTCLTAADCWSVLLANFQTRQILCCTCQQQFVWMEIHLSYIWNLLLCHNEAANRRTAMCLEKLTIKGGFFFQCLTLYVRVTHDWKAFFYISGYRLLWYQPHLEKLQCKWTSSLTTLMFWCHLIQMLLVSCWKLLFTVWTLSLDSAGGAHWEKVHVAPCDTANPTTSHPKLKPIQTSEQWKPRHWINDLVD